MMMSARSIASLQRLNARARRLSTFRILSASTTTQQEQTHGSFVPLLSVSCAALLASAYSLTDGNRVHAPTRLEAAAVLELEEEDADDDTAATTTLLNWSGTHAVNVKNNNYWEPETVADVERLVRHCHAHGQPARPMGSALSPNGIAFQETGMISMAHLDQILEVDTVNRIVTVQAGARVSQVVEALRPHGLTLPNLASIAEQQMGGFVQVSAHGTGRCVAPVDHYVTSIKLVTPAQGTVTLTEDKDGPLFHLAKVGLGCLGVVVEVTMQCIPAHNLVEHTFVLTRDEAVQQLDELLKQHKHMRYMWIPYTDAVVVVTNDPQDQVEHIPTLPTISEGERFRPLTDLLIELTKEAPEPFTKESVKGVGFGELRDALLAVDPLHVDHVKLCNVAEAEFWRKSEGYRILPSDQLLQFDCGGQVSGYQICQGFYLTCLMICPTHTLLVCLLACLFALAMGQGSLLPNGYAGKE
jgi:L-galactono-1,4-lactone dehydrogenase